MLISIFYMVVSPGGFLSDVLTFLLRLYCGCALRLPSPYRQEFRREFHKITDLLTCKPRGWERFALGSSGELNCFMEMDWNKLRELALAEIEATLAELPKPLREQAQKLPVTFERKPNAELQADGIEEDTLGLFTGVDFAGSGAEVLPPQIILFLENLWDFAGGDEEVFCDEVHTTFLHELGHFLGLDEDDLTDRGLD